MAIDEAWIRALLAAGKQGDADRVEMVRRVEEAPNRLRTDAEFHHRVRVVMAFLEVEQSDPRTDDIIKTLVAAEFADEIAAKLTGRPVIVEVPGEYLQAVADANRHRQPPGGFLFVPSEARFRSE